MCHIYHVIICIDFSVYLCLDELFKYVALFLDLGYFIVKFSKAVWRLERK